MESVKDTRITADEERLYDRQIRLWGSASQERLRSAHVLVLGISGVGAEVLKNITLAGTGKITLIDESPVQASDLRANFLLERESVGRSRAASCLEALQELNPHVKLQVLQDNVERQPADWWSQFDVVLVCNQTVQRMRTVAAAVRHAGRPLLCAATHGECGYVLCSASGHVYRLEGKKDDLVVPNDAALALAFGGDDWSVLMQKGRNRACSALFGFFSLWKFQENHGRLPDGALDAELLSAARNELAKDRLRTGTASDAISDEALALLARQAKGELAHVCAIVGGVCGQQIIRIITHVGQPLSNMFIYSAKDHIGKVEKI